MSAIEVLSVTPTYAWPIPNPDDPDDVPTDLSELAVAIENTIKGGALLPKPAVNGQWIKGVGGLPVWSALAPADLPAMVSYGTTLPAAPVDGQEAVLVDNVNNPSYSWRFRYHAGSSSAYKWEFVGGPPYYNVNPTTATLTSGVWQNVSAFAFTAPRNGEYVLQSNGQATAGANIVTVQLMHYLGTAGAGSGLGYPGQVTLPAGGWTAMVPSEPWKQALTAGQVVALMAFGNAVGGQISIPTFTVTPLRVA